LQGRGTIVTTGPRSGLPGEGVFILPVCEKIGLVISALMY